MTTWKDPCARNSETEAHDFEPLTTERTVYIGNTLAIAICRKCGVIR